MLTHTEIGEEGEGETIRVPTAFTLSDTTYLMERKTSHASFLIVSSSEKKKSSFVNSGTFHWET